MNSENLNVYGRPLESCSLNPVTGFYRDGCCKTGPQDAGRHVVCARVTSEFLEFSRERGNDLITPHPQWDFPGLKQGDQWCVCALRWKEAFDAGVAPPVVLEATHQAVLKYVSLSQLEEFAIEE